MRITTLIIALTLPFAAQAQFTEVKPGEIVTFGGS